MDGYNILQLETALSCCHTFMTTLRQHGPRDNAFLTRALSLLDVEAGMCLRQVQRWVDCSAVKKQLLSAYLLVHTLDKHWPSDKKPTCLHGALKKFKEDMREQLGREYLGFVMTVIRHLSFVDEESASVRAIKRLKRRLRAKYEKPSPKQASAIEKAGSKSRKSDNSSARAKHKRKTKVPSQRTLDRRFIDDSEADVTYKWPDRVCSSQSRYVRAGM